MMLEELMAGTLSRTGRSLPDDELPPVDWTAKWQESREESSEALIRACGIPARYDGIKLSETIIAGHEAGMWAKLAEGTGLWLTGPAGTGKTTVAAAIAREAVRLGWSVRFANAVDMYQSLRDSYNGTGEAKAMARYTAPRLLVIDDLGKGKPTAWVAEKLYSIVNSRWDAGVPTIVTTQYSEDELARSLTVDGDTNTAQAILSRIVGSTVRIVFKGEDRRLG